MLSPSVEVNSVIHERIKTVSVTRSVEEICSSFSFTTPDFKTGDDDVAPEINPLDKCDILYADQLITQGVIFKESPVWTEQAHNVSWAGRGIASALVDCSIDVSPDLWRNVPLSILAAILSRPYGVTVVDETGETEPFTVAKAQPGESPHAMLDRYARQRDVLIVAGDGAQIKLIKPGNWIHSGVELEQGKNIKSASGSRDFSKRYYKYIVKGQSWGNDELNGEIAAQSTGVAYDSFVTDKTRTKIIVANNSGIGEAITKRARFEASVRAARSNPITVVVSGWLKPNGSGEVWREGELVTLTAPWLKIHSPEEFLIGKVSYNYGNGTSCTLTLAAPGSYELNDDVANAKTSWQQYFEANKAPEAA